MIIIIYNSVEHSYLYHFLKKSHLFAFHKSIMKINSNIIHLKYIYFSLLQYSLISLAVFSESGLESDVSTGTVTFDLDC